MSSVYIQVPVTTKPEKLPESNKGGQHVGVRIHHYHEAVVVIPEQDSPTKSITIAGYNFRTGRWYVEYNHRTTDTTGATDITDKITHYLVEQTVGEVPSDEDVTDFLQNFRSPAFPPDHPMSKREPTYYELARWMRSRCLAAIAGKDERIEELRRSVGRSGEDYLLEIKRKENHIVHLKSELASSEKREGEFAEWCSVNEWKFYGRTTRGNVWIKNGTEKTTTKTLNLLFIFNSINNGR